jgi:hypothetical protein
VFANEEGTFLETTDVTGVMERKPDGFASHLSFRIEGEEWEWQPDRQRDLLALVTNTAAPRAESAGSESGVSLASEWAMSSHSARAARPTSMTLTCRNAGRGRLLVSE